MFDAKPEQIAAPEPEPIVAATAPDAVRCPLCPADAKSELGDSQFYYFRRPEPR